MTSGPRAPRGPIKVRPMTARDQAVLDLALPYLVDYPGTGEHGEQAGHWYRRRAAPELILREFLLATGREHLLDEHSGREVEVHLPQGGETQYGVTIWFRNGDRLRQFVEFPKLRGFMGQLLVGIAETLPRRRARRRRRRPRDAVTVARVLAIHYLSRSGGGERTLEEAAELYRTTMDQALARNRAAGRAALAEMGGSAVWLASRTKPRADRAAGGLRSAVADRRGCRQ